MVCHRLSNMDPQPLGVKKRQRVYFCHGHSRLPPMEPLSHQAGRQFPSYLPLACGVTKQCTWNEKLQLASLHFAHYHQQWRLYCWNLTHTFANNAWGRTKFCLRFCTVGPLKVNGATPQLDVVICDSSWDSCTVGLPLRPTALTFPTQT